MTINLTSEQQQILKQLVIKGIECIRDEAREITKDFNKPALFRRACEEELVKFEEVVNIVKGEIK